MEFRVKGGEMFSLVNPVCFNYKQSHGVFYGGTVQNACPESSQYSHRIPSGIRGIRTYAV